MIIANSKIKLMSGISGGAKEVISGFKVPIKINNNCYTTQLFSIDGKNIPTDTKAYVQMHILLGEIEYEKIIKGAKFEIVVGKKSYGMSEIINVSEIYIEKEDLQLLDLRKRREIVAWAERNEKALVFEDVYSIL